MNLPKEIYLNIFQHLGKKQLLKCSMVCKDWSLPALQIYYNELKFTERNTNRLISVINQDQYFQHCHWVKSVELCQKETSIFELSSRSNEEEEMNLTKEQFLKFFTYLPNLKNLTLNTTYDKDYMEYLLDLNTDTYLTQLEKISSMDDPTIGFDSFYDLRCNLLYKFRNSLKELEVFQDHPESNIVTQYGGITNYLNQFKRVTHLKYYNYSTQAVTVYELQVGCPNLKTLELRTDGHSLTYQEGRHAFLNTSNLQSLELTFPRMTSSFADMLIHHLPTKINKLYVELDDIGLYDWIHLIGLERVLKLAERMSKLSSAAIRCEPYRNYQTESVHETSQMTLFFQVLNAFKGDKNVFCTAEFSDFRSIYKSMTYSNGVLDVIYGLNYQDMYGHNQDDGNLDFELAIPDKTVSILGPEIFNQLQFYLCTTNDQLAYKTFKYSLTNCPHLQHVNFMCLNTPNHEFSLSTSVKQRKRSEPSTKTEQNIKVIKLVNFVPSSDFIKILTTYLPNITYFKCERKKKSMHNEVAMIDLSGLNSLETFHLNMKFYMKKSDEACKLKINYIDGQEELYEFRKVESCFEVNVISLESSVVPTLTLNFKKPLKTIKLKMRGDNSTKIKDGVIQ